MRETTMEGFIEVIQPAIAAAAARATGNVKLDAYSKHYRISAEELSWLGERVEELGRAVQEVCTDRLAKLASAAKA